jgi:AcrR family transcriptional regulator
VVKKDFISGNTKKTVIINALFQCIYKDGANNVTMRKIALQANVSLGTIHYHFKTKENIFGECIQAIFSELIKNIEKRYKPEDPPEVKLKEFLTEGKEFTVREKQLYLLYLDVCAFCLRNDKMTDVFIEWHKKVTGIMTTILEDGIKKGIFNKVDTDTISNLFYFFTDGIGLHWCIQRERIDIDRYYEIVFDFIRKTIIKT